MNESERTDSITPEPEHAEPARAADELLSHGLLTFLHRDPPAETERRMRAVMRLIADEAPVHQGGARRSRRLVFPHARRWIALAACLVIAMGLVYLGMPTTSTAQAMVLASAATLREPGDRRFEVRVQPRGEKELQQNPIGTIDTRSGSGTVRLVARLQPEEGVWITFGRDEQGPWMVFPDGRMERNPPTASLPRLGAVADQPVLPESVDRVLEDLAASYTLERTTEKGADGASVLEHIVGVRRPDRAPGVPRIEVWIDPHTSAVKKVELTLPEGPLNPRGMGPGGPEGPGGPGGRRGGPDGPGPGGPDGPRGERDRRPLPPPDGLGGDEPPPDLRPEGRGGRPDGPRGKGGPRGEGRGPRFNPARVELRPVPPPPLPPEWFSPGHHARKGPPPEQQRRQEP